MLGSVKGRFTGTSPIRSAIQTMLIGGLGMRQLLETRIGLRFHVYYGEQHNGEQSFLTCQVYE